MTRQVGFGNETFDSNKNINQTVTLSHICLILAYTITSILYFNVVFKTDFYLRDYRTISAWATIGAVCDISLTCMIWFVLDEERQATILNDGRFSYAVLDVIQISAKTSISNQDSSESEDENFSRNRSSSPSFRVSELMIAQFFKHERSSDYKRRSNGSYDEYIGFQHNSQKVSSTAYLAQF